MGAGKRLTYYIEKQGYTKRYFCDNFSFDYASFTQVLAETRPMGIKIVDKVHFALPKMNVHWMLYGEGSEEFQDDFSNILNEPLEFYGKENDIIESIIVKYLDSDKIKNKIYEIIKQKAG
jgi:hypothetical protein